LFFTKNRKGSRTENERYRVENEHEKKRRVCYNSICLPEFENIR